MNRVTLSYCFSGDYVRPEYSGAVFCRKKRTSEHAWGMNLLDMPRTPYWASEGKHSQQFYPACPFTPPSRLLLLLLLLLVMVVVVAVAVAVAVIVVNIPGVLLLLAPAVTVGETEGAMDSTSVFFGLFFLPITL